MMNMEKKDYERLNVYLNDIFLVLNERNSFLLNHILIIAKINDKYLDFINRFDLSEDTKENKLSYKDIVMITRNIIESIDKSYLQDYDELLSTGKLDFSYDNSYSDSCFVPINNLVNINREFNFNDILTLVHEFINYTNGKEKLGKNRYLLTEFLSIYFEIYALDYLLQQGVPKDQISIYDRLRNNSGSANSLYRYEIIFLAYEKFGNINENTSKDLNNYFCNISKEDFEKDCESFLKYIDKRKTKYKQELPLEKKFNEDDFIFELSLSFCDNYRYLLGTLLAYYARKNSKMEDIVYLNNHINDDNINNLPLSKVLKTIGIDINDKEFINKSLYHIDSYINEYSNEKVGGL